MVKRSRRIAFGSYAQGPKLVSSQIYSYHTEAALATGLASTKRQSHNTSAHEPNLALSSFDMAMFSHHYVRMFSSEIKSVHFVGLCGTAMASTAVALKQRGLAISGSDQNVYPPMSTFLAERQIEVMNGYAERNLAHQPDLVVIGNAISRGNPEAEFC